MSACDVRVSSEQLVFFVFSRFFHYFFCFFCFRTYCKLITSYRTEHTHEQDPNAGNSRVAECRRNRNLQEPPPEEPQQCHKISNEPLVLVRRG